MRFKTEAQRKRVMAILSKAARRHQQRKGPFCSKCGRPYSAARAKLGYTTCKNCGAGEAATASEAKKGRVALAYNKGAYQYITPGMKLKEIGSRKI